MSAKFLKGNVRVRVKVAPRLCVCLGVRAWAASWAVLQVAKSPEGLCDGIYYGEERENVTTLRGPSLFTATCFEPEDCGDFLA